MIPDRPSSRSSEHPAGRRIRGKHPASGVGEQDRADSERCGHAHRQRARDGVMPLVHVESPALHEHFAARQPSGDEFAGVACDGGLREAGNIAVWEPGCVLEALGDAAEAGAEDEEGDGAAGAEEALDGGNGELHQRPRMLIARSEATKQSGCMERSRASAHEVPLFAPGLLRPLRGLAMSTRSTPVPLTSAPRQSPPR